VIKSIEGFEEAFERLERMQEDWEKLQHYTALKAADELRELLGENSDYLHLVEVNRKGETNYGITLEPETEAQTISELPENAVLVVSPTEEGGYDEIENQNPWVPEYLPEAPEGEEEGFVWIRKTNQADIQMVRDKNQKAISSMGYEKPEGEPIMSPDQPIPMVEDVMFNQLRGEFGFDDRKTPKWRPAIQEVVEDRIYDIFEKAVQDYVEGSLDLGEFGSTEERTGEFFDSFSEFTLAVVPRGLA
jgi:hypothetical protein